MSHGQQAAESTQIRDDSSHHIHATTKLVPLVTDQSAEEVVIYEVLNFVVDKDSQRAALFPFRVETGDIISHSVGIHL